MNARIGTTAALGLSAVLLTMTSAHGDDKASPVSWKKTVIEGKFRSEGVAIADVNKDGKLDVLIGDSWYEAPSWAKHDIRKPGDYGDGLHSYSECMTCWADDVNGDGWADQIVIGFPGEPRLLVREPQGQAGPLAPARDLAQRLQRDAALRRPLRRRPSRAGHGLAAQGQGQRRPDGLVHARQRPHAALGDAPGQRAQQARQGHPRHLPILARPRRGRPQRRRPQGRDLHRRLVGTARVGPQDRHALDVPPRQPGRRRGRHDRLRREPATARPTSSPARPTSTASGGSSRAPRRTARPSSPGTTSSPTSSPRPTP